MKRIHSILLAGLFVFGMGIFAQGLLAAPPRTQSYEYSIPTIDLAHETHRQVVVDREAGQYLGHPTTLLLEDNKTMLIVYPKGHGKGGIVYKRSKDGGKTWSERLPTPSSWVTSREVPTLHRVIDKQGKKRIVMFSGLYPIRMSVSEDNGNTWSELKSIGDFGGIVTMGCVERLKNGDYMALFHDDGRFIKGANTRQNPPVFLVYKTISQDGGLTWSAPSVIAKHSAAHLCEPGIFRSPDGKQLAVLLRENSRKYNSFVIFSDDEGETWSVPKETPASLTGDRHTGRYSKDGRLFISFRDTTHVSPTKGDWVGWVGTYQDIVDGKEGQYRVRLMDNTKGADCAYPPVERLPDDTFVTTTYGHWTKGEQPYIVSVRFKLSELDARAKHRPIHTTVFKSGENGYNTFRIPSIIKNRRGHLLAFCEARKASRSDKGDIDLVLKRSQDNGRTWSKMEIIWDDQKNTCGNPCPVMDETTGTIWLLLTHNLGKDAERDIIHHKAEGTRTVWVSKSEDDGDTWFVPNNITSSAKWHSWGWYATGPGVGIQIKYGPHKGRLVIPCDHSYNDPEGQIHDGPYGFGSHAIYSDDHGATWQLSSGIHPNANECQVVELADREGTLLMNMRSYEKRNRRTQSISFDGGRSWSKPKDAPDLIEPVCQASILRYSWPAEGRKGRLLFSNPASRSREKMTVRVSYDDGISWPIAKELYFGQSAYSSLVVLKSGEIGCLYERGGKSAYETISFARFPLAWLEK
ncbi:MAG: hypothetical protein ACI8QF_001410 [Limisphaerales bacterium]|jgi:hypothetical protein